MKMEENQQLDSGGYSNKVDPLNVLRVAACLCVFELHTTLFENTSFIHEKGLTFLLRTPAWGGVWMFLILGGYLAGKSYYDSRYTSTLEGTIRYYVTRIKKTIIPTAVFITICTIFVYADFIYQNKSIILQFITFTYRGDPGVDGIGACWYVFMLFWMYLLTPLVGLVMNRLRELKHHRGIYILIWIGLAAATLFYRIYCFKHNRPWMEDVYTKALANLDLFFGGFIAAYIHFDSMENHSRISEILTKYNKGFRAAAYAVFFGVIVVNCYIYNRSFFTGYPYSFIYSYLFPSVYLAVLTFYIIVFDREKVKYSRASLDTVKKNPFKLIDAFAGVTFEFYLFHSLILNRISAYIAWRGSSLAIHFLLISIVFLITLACSIGFQRMMYVKK